MAGLMAEPNMHFTHAENFMIRVITVLAVLIALISWIKAIHINIGMYDLAFVVDMFFILGGQYFRSVRRNESVAVVLTVIGLSLASTQLVGAFNYMFLPYSFHGFDQMLATVDSWFGYVWADFATAFVAWPQLTSLLKTVYDSSQTQIGLMILLLGFTGKTRALEEFMLVLMIGVLACISIWALFPSSSPVGFQPLAADVAKQLNLTLNPHMGAELVRLSHEAISAYPPAEPQGMVGFPSFHTVMLVATVYASRVFKLTVLPFLAWNILMFPAILLHGAHNLMDVFGGLAVAAFSIYCARSIIRHQPDVPEWARPAVAPLGTTESKPQSA